MTLEEKISDILDTGFAEVPVQSDHAALANYYPVNFSVGNLSTQQIIGIMASRLAMVNQFNDDVTAAAGIGPYGLNIQMLTIRNYVKSAVAESLSGTGLGDDTANGLGIAEYLSGMDQARVFQALNNRSSWTNQSGIDSLDSLLNNPELQNQIYQQQILENFRYLEKQGIAQGLEDEQLGALLAVRTGLGNAAMLQLTDAAQVPDEVVSAYVRNALQGFNIATSPEMNSILGSPESTALRRIVVGTPGSGDLISQGDSDIIGPITGGAAALDTTPRSYEASQYLNAVKSGGSNFAEDVASLIATGLALAGAVKGAVGTAQNIANSVKTAAEGLKAGAANLGQSLSNAAGAFGLSNIKKAVAGFLPTQGTLNRAALESQVKAIIIDPTDPNSAKLQVPQFSLPSLADIKNLARQAIASIPNPVTQGLEAFNAAQGTAYSSLDQASAAYNNAVGVAQKDLLGSVGGGKQAAQAINSTFAGQGDQDYSVQDLAKLRLGINSVTSTSGAAGVNLITIAESDALNYYRS